jgi:GxxExxY protein
MGEHMNTRNEKAILDLCDHIRKVSFDLYVYLKHGHLEKVYENGLAHRVRKDGLFVEQQKALQVRDKDGTILGDYFADLLVESCLIIELKACKMLTDNHFAQVLGYLHASNFRNAILINFGAPKIQIRKFIF